MKIFKEPIVIVDTETTGFHREAEVIEIGAVCIDEWGRERAGMDQVSCFNLAPPSACSDLQFPEPNPFENTSPINGAPCEAIGINGATGRTQIPPIEEMREDDPMEDNMIDEDTMDEESTGDEDEGCAQGPTKGRQGISTLIYLLFVTWLIGLGPRRQFTRVRQAS